MTFVTASLLAGSSLIAVPIILHLIMRRKPKLFEFPALRFIQKRHDVNQRRLRLRHLLLLLLRAGVIALLAFALARPSMRFAGALGSQESPVAAALVFDTAPHMQYRHDNKTRLEVAREMGLWLLAQLPKESQIAVLDTGLMSGSFDADRGVSKQRIERLETVNNSQPLAGIVGEAVRVLAKSDLAQKEIYVFTDLARSAWPADTATALQDRLGELPGVAVYVIDVGVAEPVDFALGDLQLGRQVLSGRGTLDLQTQVSCSGAEGQRTVEILLDDAEEKRQKRGEQTVSLRPGEAKQLEFQVRDLSTGTHQGLVRILGQDGLEADDARYFTVEVRPAWPVLIVAPKPVEQHAIYLAEALAPSEARRRKEARFDCQIVDFADLGRQSLDKYAAVCLLDPAPLEPAAWQGLANYVAEGHGLAVFLGRNARPVDSFNTPAAQQVLPGKLVRQVPRPDGDLALAPRDYQHPILKAFARRATATPWSVFSVFRYWELADLAEGVGAIIRYNDDRPALFERPVGSGRVLVMTTPVSDRATRDAWNLLPVGEAWPFVILANEMMSYLVGGTQQQLNYFAGQAAVVPLDEQSRRRTYILTTPGGGTSPMVTEPKQQELTITSTDQAGNYRLQSGGRGSAGERGFSVNLAPAQTDLARISEQELAEEFGPFRYRLAQTRDQVDRSVSIGRVGRELYPPLILLVAIVLAMEYVVANRFYKE